MHETVAGRYLIEEKIGEGGMGEVLAAYDETLQRRVVLKSIREDRRAGELAHKRFRREAQILSQLDHPTICRIFDLVEADGTEYLVLEHIEGRTLHDALDGELSDEDRYAIAAGILDALVVAHAAGIVHRDLKPGNVMITPAGEVKVLDFGLAHLATEDEIASGTASSDSPTLDTAAWDVDTAAWELDTAAWELDTAARELGSAERTLGMRTEAGTISGTLLYMSPEQAAGVEIGPASDVYSLGLLFQELFTGRPPQPTHLAPLELHERAMNAESLPVEGLDADVTRWIEQMKASSPTMRPTAHEAAERLRWIRGRGRRRLVRAGIAAGALLVIGGATKYTLDLEAERNAAIGDRKRAERLIEFMIGDLHDKLMKEGGKLDLLDDSYAMALEYFVAVDEDDLTENELMSRCALLGRMSQTRSAQGKHAEALAFSRESVRQAEALLARNPDSPEYIVNLSNSVFYLGLAHYTLEQLDDAIREYERYRALSEELLARDPDNRDWQVEVAYSWLNLGSTHLEAGEGVLALEEMQRSLDIWNRMLEEAPDDTDLLAEKAEVQSYMGDALLSLDRADEALPILSAELGIRERIYDANGLTVHDKERLAVCHFYLGKAHLATNGADASRHLRRASELMDELHAHDPANTEWSHQLARSWLTLGTAHARGGEPERAREVWDRAAGLLDELLATNASNVTWRGTRDEVRSRLQELP